MTQPTAEILDKASNIKLLVLDVDGVMTDGKLYFGQDGEHLKRFSILDGLGIKLLQNYGVETAIITGRTSGMVATRANELNIRHIIQGREDKLQALEELIATLGIALTETAYVGDDLPDLAAIVQSRLGVAVANAYTVVREHADWVCDKSGGNGAVREVADIILKAKGNYEDAISHFLPPSH